MSFLILVLGICFASEFSPHEIVVAVIDTGIDVNHPDLQDNLWTNPGEAGDKANNGIDDDNNGFIDDVHGWNFVSNSQNLTDRHGHGTHISGIIKSLAPQSRIMAIKYYDPKSEGSNNIAKTIQAFEYAIKMKAQIINFSGGGFGKSPEEEAVIRKAQEKGILVIAAAGNEGTNSDRVGFYPASYHLSNILSVTAIDSQGLILSTSNFGTQTVHLAAPGKDIESTLPKNLHGKMTGTSQATAYASGVAALYLAQLADKIPPSDLIEILGKTGSPESSLYNKTKYGTRINTKRLLAMRDLKTDAFGFRIQNTKSLKAEVFSSESFEVLDERNLTLPEAP